MYGELSKASTTQAKLQAQGGIHKAVSIDSAESSIKAATQKGAVTEQAAQLAGGGEGGKKIADAIKNASADGADLMAAGIIRAAQNLGAAQSGAKTVSDMNQVKETGGKEAFIEAASVEGAKRGATSKVQNIDLGDADNANKQVQGILSTTKTQDRQKVLNSLKNFGMVTEDSTLDNVQATSGTQFLKGKAAAAAATMSRDDRLSFAGYSYHLSTDSTTGDTRVEATNAQGLTTGRYVHDKTGVKVDNPIQMMQSKVGIDTTDTYTGQDINGDGSPDGLGSIAGNMAIDIAAASTAYGTYKFADKVSGGKLSKTEDIIKHKAKGDVKVGNDWYDKEDIPILKESGIISEDKDGKYHYTEGKSYKEGRTLIQDSLSRPTVSAGAFQTPQTNRPINTTTNTTTNSVNPDIDDSLKNSLDSDTALPNGNDNYNTKNFKNQTNVLVQKLNFTIETILYLTLKSYKSQIYLSLS